MSELSIGNIKDRLNDVVKTKVEEMASNIDTLIKYDAMVESIDLSSINVSTKRISETEYTITLDLEELNDYYKHLVRDIYYPNSLKRRK